MTSSPGQPGWADLFHCGTRWGATHEIKSPINACNRDRRHSTDGPLPLSKIFIQWAARKRRFAACRQKESPLFTAVIYLTQTDKVVHAGTSALMKLQLPAARSTFGSSI